MNHEEYLISSSFDLRDAAEELGFLGFWHGLDAGARASGTLEDLLSNLLATAPTYLEYARKDIARFALLTVTVQPECEYRLRIPPGADKVWVCTNAIKCVFLNSQGYCIAATDTCTGDIDYILPMSARTLVLKHDRSYSLPITFQFKNGAHLRQARV